MFLLNKDFRTMEHYRNSLFGRFYIYYVIRTEVRAFG